MLYELLIAISVLGISALSLSTIWSRKESWVRSAAFAAAFVLSPMVVGATFTALSHPSPYIPGLTVPEGKYKVSAAKLVHGVAIYVLIDAPFLEHPRYYRLPWSRDAANAIQDMMTQEMTGQIQGYMMEVPPFEPSLDTNDPQFHPLPQPIAIPDKVLPSEEPERYERAD